MLGEHRVTTLGGDAPSHERGAFVVPGTVRRRTRQTTEQVSSVPTGKVKWYDAERGFGFLSQEQGEDVYVRSSALPAGVEGLKPGQKVEFGMASGKRGPQALSLTVLASPPSVQQPAHAPQRKHTPDELHGMVEDMITLLEATVQPELRKGRHPDRKAAQRIAEVLRAVARELDS